MNEKEKTFNRIFKEKGGLYQIIEDDIVDQILVQVKQLVVEAINYLKPRYRTLPEIFVGVIDNASFNAFAAKENNEFFIGINAGTVYLINDMFLKMFATKSVLPDLGNSELETDEKKTANKIIVDGGVGMDYYPNVFYPNDKMRYQYSQNYTTIAITHLVFHEIGHIVRGHLGYKEQHTKSHIWSEYNNYGRKEGELNPQVSQTLEMDADSFATNHAYILATFWIRDRKSAPPLSELIYTNFEAFSRHWFFAIYCFFRLHKFDAVDLNSAKMDSHPLAPARMWMILQNVLSIIEAYEIGDPANMIKACVSSMREAEDAHSAISHQTGDFKVFLNNLSSCEEYISDVKSNWNNVRPLLEPFAFGDLPPLVKKILNKSATSSGQ